MPEYIFSNLQSILKKCLRLYLLAMKKYFKKWEAWNLISVVKIDFTKVISSRYNKINPYIILVISIRFLYFIYTKENV